jgi:carboxyl-terminal processing protease
LASCWFLITQYRNTHAKIGDAKTFTLSDADFADFTKYIAGKDYKYSNRSEKVLADLKTETDKDKEFADIKTEYDALKVKLATAKANDLQQHKEEIRQVLENEIAARYYFEKGRYECNFKYDKELARAGKLMNDKTEVATILKGEGGYKIIGKPKLTMAAVKPDTKNEN